MKFNKIVNVEDKLTTPDDSVIGCFVELDLRYPDEMKKKTDASPVCLENKVSPQDILVIFWMRWSRWISYTQQKAMYYFCDLSDKKYYFFHYRILKFYARHGMTDDKIHDIISFKRSK